MMKLKYLVSLLVLCAGPVVLVAQEESTAERKAIKRENIEWKLIRHVKFHQGKQGAAEKIVENYYKKAAAMAGTPIPEMRFFMETGEWDIIVVWNMTEGLEGMNWQRSPNNVAWRNALDEIAGGKEEGQAIIEEYQSYVKESYGEIAYIQK